VFGGDHIKRSQAITNKNTYLKINTMAKGPKVKSKEKEEE
jgi:hypothetical protein